jgi:hypothetical protein
MIPHKSCKYCAILDLSFQLRLAGLLCPSVNEATKHLAPVEAMDQLGSVLPHLIEAMAQSTEALGPILFTKLDIKDGYWRMVIPAEESWNFAYMLPPRVGDTDIHLVVPSALQMWWSESPPFFCMASEMARDLAAERMQEAVGSLPEHPLEEWMLPQNWPEEAMPAIVPNFMCMVEVYVDDFIVAAQCSDPDRSITSLHAGTLACHP